MNSKGTTGYGKDVNKEYGLVLEINPRNSNSDSRWLKSRTKYDHKGKHIGTVAGIMLMPATSQRTRDVMSGFNFPKGTAKGMEISASMERTGIGRRYLYI